MNHSRTIPFCIFRYGSAALTLVAIACSRQPETEKPGNDVPVRQTLPNSTHKLASLIGKWENVDSKTAHLTRVEISNQDSTAQLLVRCVRH